MYRRYRLRAILISLILSSNLLTFAIVGTTVLSIRLPDVVERSKERAKESASSAAFILENSLSQLEAELKSVAKAYSDEGTQTGHAVLRQLLNLGRFSEIYFVDHEGLTEAGQVNTGRFDISGSELFHRASSGPQTATWSDRYLSAVSSKPVIGLAISLVDRFLIGEISADRLTQQIAEQVFGISETTLVIDGQGNVVVDKRNRDEMRYANLSNHPVFESVKHNHQIPEDVLLAGEHIYPAAIKIQTIGWLVLTGAPAEWDNHEFRATVYAVIGAFIVSAIIGIVITLVWASSMQKPIGRIIEQSHRIADGDYKLRNHTHSIIEFGELSDNLNTTAIAISERERQIQRNRIYFQHIFDSVPISIILFCRAGGGYLVDNANRHWLDMFALSQEDLISADADELALFIEENDKAQFLAELASTDDKEGFEARLKGHAGREIQCRFSFTSFRTDLANYRLVVFDDVTSIRQAQEQLSEINAYLEIKVDERTRQLADSNRELTSTVEQLQATQNQLIQTEKLSALGGMVAGIAHELNTPVGNSYIGASILKDHLKIFKKELDSGLRRSTLMNFVETVETMTEVVSRNLTRASDLVASFKQVTADRTSSQRREFQVSELLHEIQLTTLPALKSTAFGLHVEAEDDPLMDSYPGPLGQVITNLINNSIVHGLDGRGSGNIFIRTGKHGEDRISISVTDDGCGMEKQTVDRIFDPFFTTKLGQGGTGLGMHISYNIVTNVLGGDVEVESQPGVGTTIRLILPLVAPSSVEDAGVGGDKII